LNPITRGKPRQSMSKTVDYHYKTTVWVVRISALIALKGTKKGGKIRKSLFM
jgi:hypothetical protein